MMAIGRFHERAPVLSFFKGYIAAPWDYRSFVRYIYLSTIYLRTGRTVEEELSSVVVLLLLLR